MNQELRIRNKKFRIKSIIRNSLFIIRKSHGFTLIELLIVIAIIGVLATILLANFIGVRQRSRDAQRKADLRQIQGAIELYKADQGVYPPMPLYSINCGSYAVSSYSSIKGGTPSITYMEKIPCDPNPSIYIGAFSTLNGNYYYRLDVGSIYYLDACIENTNDTDRDAYSGAIPTALCTTGKLYQLTNP